MQLLANLFVGKPLNITLVALVFLAGYFAMRSGNGLNCSRLEEYA